MREEVNTKQYVIACYHERRYRCSNISQIRRVPRVASLGPDSCSEGFHPGSHGPRVGFHHSGRVVLLQGRHVRLQGRSHVHPPYWFLMRVRR